MLLVAATDDPFREQQGHYTRHSCRCRGALSSTSVPGSAKGSAPVARAWRCGCPLASLKHVLVPQLKGIANGCAIAALDTVFSREVLQSDKYGFYFQKSTTSALDWFTWADQNEFKLQLRRAEIHNGINEKYTWETVSNLYLYHLKALANKN